MDFDGVINDFRTFDSVNNSNVQILKQIINDTEAKIVVTSSTKYSFQRKSGKYDMEKTQCGKYVEQLKEKGIDVLDFTPYINENREEEIKEYLKLHPEIEQFLILDDDYIMESIKNHQIYLDLQSGLQRKHYYSAIKILNGELNFYHDNDNLEIDRK